MTTEALPENAQAYVLQPDDGQRIENLGLRILTTNAQTNGSFMAGTVTNPGPGGPPLHTHHALDEFLFVLQGTYRFRVGDREFEGGSGTFAYIPRGTSHTFAGVGTEEGRVLFVTLPGMEAFLQGISELESRGVDQRDMANHYRAFESEIDGPPLVG